MPGSAVSDLAGRVLAGRYLLHAAIGTGASGRVYVAEDTRLRRRVAVKVLHAALAEDAAFLRRFRAEAQLAASLHHPHIVTVHDWGEDDVPFMVLELLEGGSLRGMLDRGTELTVSQAARVGRDVASALEYAHARGVLHRDIKPANLLFDEHGIVRVADFGLARALAEASWTEPAGAVFGTARYASPEQAQGVKLDARSDLYSLALVLVEAVTRELPFTAETTLGMLTARTQQPLTAPEDLGPLGPAIDRAGAIDPDERYPNAGTMRAALADAADELPPPGPLTLAGMVDRADPHPTRAAPAGRSRLFDQDAADAPTDAVTRPLPLPEFVLEPPAPPEKPPRYNEDTGGTGMQRRLVPFVVGIILLVTVAIATAALARVSGATPISVPTLIGMTQQDAINAAQTRGLVASVGEPRASPDPPGRVIAQSPEQGTLTTGRHIELTVSSGPAPIEVPSIVGKQWKDAKAILTGARWLYETRREYNETIDKDVVLRVSPSPGLPVSPDTSLTVFISDGHAPVPVPDESGKTYDDAKADLEAKHFTVPPAVEDFDNDVAKGDVIGTDPEAGRPAPYGSAVTVHVSKGPDLVAVPNLVNLTRQAASNALEQKGLTLKVRGKYRGGDLVSSQDPCPGKKVKRGSEVTVTFRRDGSIFGNLLCG
jgi:beta-lactam-binding protein with PASTA domain/tRNA A-37 threonylcarbamoyl transferase component Bud32